MMLVAFLRGHLKPDRPWGLRSRLREEIVFEGLLADAEAEVLLSRAEAASAQLPALAHESRQKVMSHIRIRQARAVELMCGKLYREDSAERDEISLVQLHRLAEKGNLLEKLNAKHAARKEPLRDVITGEIYHPPAK